MAEISIIGDRDTPEYVEAEEKKKYLPFAYILNMCVLSLINPQQYDYMFNMMYNRNGLTTVVFFFLITVLIVYPWMMVCFFIGQYTKRYFLFTRRMVPILKYGIILHFALSFLIAAEMDTFPSMSKLLWNSVFNEKSDMHVWRSCYRELKHQLKHKANCTLTRNIAFPAACHMLKTRELAPPDHIFDDIYHPLSGTLFIFCLTMMPIRLYNVFVSIVILFLYLNYAITMLFASISVPQHKLFEKFFRVSKDLSSDSFTDLLPLLGYVMKTLTAVSPLMVFCGTLLPSKRSASVTSWMVSFAQFSLYLFFFYSFLGNISVLSKKFDVDIDCFASPSKTSFIEMVIATRKEALFYYYKDQGPKGRIFMCILSMIMLRIMDLLYLTTHCKIYCITLLASWNYMSHSKWLRRILIFFICFIANWVAQISSMKGTEVEYYFTTSSSIISIFFAFTFTFGVFAIYGLDRLNIDYMFLNGDYMLTQTRCLILLLPIIVSIHFFVRFYYWAILKPWSIVLTPGFLKCNKAPYYGFPLIVMCIVLFHSLLRMISSYRRWNLSRAFYPNEKYGPWSPPGTDKIKERNAFHPETAVRFEGDYYRCLHHCWLDNKIIDEEIKECNKTFYDIAAQIKAIDLETYAPDIYREYEHVLKYLQPKRKTKKYEEETKSLQETPKHWFDKHVISMKQDEGSDISNLSSKSPSLLYDGSSVKSHSSSETKSSRGSKVSFDVNSVGEQSDTNSATSYSSGSSTSSSTSSIKSKESSSKKILDDSIKNKSKSDRDETDQNPSVKSIKDRDETDSGIKRKRDGGSVKSKRDRDETDNGSTKTKRDRTVTDSGSSEKKSYKNKPNSDSIKSDIKKSDKTSKSSHESGKSRKNKTE